MADGQLKVDPSIVEALRSWSVDALLDIVEARHRASEAILGASQNYPPHAFYPPLSGSLRDAVPVLMRESSTMTITEEDALIRHILISTIPGGSPISSGAKAGAILSRYVVGEVPPGLRQLVTIGIGKSAREVRLKGRADA